jgi:hypothetical protein
MIAQGYSLSRRGSRRDNVFANLIELTWRRGYRSDCVITSGGLIDRSGCAYTWRISERIFLSEHLEFLPGKVTMEVAVVVSSL